ncbi:gamma-glutamyltransferase [Ammoniphilus resinae]|uniref:Glutathione hydrolase proenzyme n=1 Tax=Ammoniphilus resinae TaxID=861532 RepID=A0ABS4GM13_9BACL|nr:gamma-glutamyltransferase [Ammoniphilus resinae]MBP1931291.1 gamma-glutamyltranspeptidase/glutathione hydrolase [Ammoniphilus resinae]
MARLLSRLPNRTQYRPMAIGNNGMVASASPLAATVGLEILKEGGNAFDAAIAVAFMENVTLPAMTTVGGDAYGILYQASTNQVYALNGSGAAPEKASIEWFREQGYKKLPYRGVLSSSIPGEVHALMTIHQRMGSLPLEKLMKPAIDAAENGFRVSELLQFRIRKVEHLLRNSKAMSSIFLPNGKVPEVGSLLIQKDLAKTLRTLCKNGLHDFYRGEIAGKITNHMKKNGGLIEYKDLQQHESELSTPISTNYRGYDIFQTAPPSQGLIVLQSLNLLEAYDVASMRMDSPELIHLMVEIKKLAFSDRLKYCGDPRFVPFDYNLLISKDYANKQRNLINRNAAMEHYNGFVEHENGDTTYLAITDKDGNCVSYIHSLSGVEFGSCEMIEETGIILNQRLGRGFTLDKRHPNALAPNKRTMHTLNAYMIFKDNDPCFVGGTPGGDQQPQWNFQVIVNLLDYKLNVQEAAEYPRWYSYPGTDPVHLQNPFELRMEVRFDPFLYRELEAKGHRINYLPPYDNGGVQLIEVNRQLGTYFGGTDPRIGGMALGY